VHHFGLPSGLPECTSHDVSTEFLLSIGKVKHGKCLYTYLYKYTFNVSLSYALRVITHHVTQTPRMGHRGCVGIMLLGCYTDGGIWSNVGLYLPFFLSNFSQSAM